MPQTDSAQSTTPATMAGHTFVPVQQGGPQLSNAVHTGNRQIEGMAVEAEQRATLLSPEEQKVKVAKLLEKYGDDIRCKNTNNGYELRFHNRNISNDRVQEILRSLDGIDISSLVLISLNNLTSFNGNGLGNVRKLFLTNCQNLQSVDGNGLSNLMTLRLIKCPKMKSFNGNGMASLNDLSVKDCGLTGFNGEGLGALTKLSFSQCPQMESFNGNGMASLNDLSIKECGLTGFNGEGLGALTKLSFSQCPQMESFNGNGLTNLQELDFYYCGFSSLDFSVLGNLKFLRISACSNLTSFNSTGLANLERLEAVGNGLRSFNGEELISLQRFKFENCSTFHGTIDLSRSLSLRTLRTQFLQDDVRIITSPEAPINRSLGIQFAVAPRITRSVENIEQYRSILRDANDISTADNIITEAENSDGTDDQKTDFKNFLKSYCERYANASEDEQAKAAQKYKSALNNFRDYLKNCTDAFATGLARLKIELEIGELLERCQSANERQQVLFSVYAQEQIERSLAKVDALYKQVTNRELYEPLELQLALNAIFNTPYNQNMTFRRCAYDSAQGITDAYDNHKNQFENFATAGTSFLDNNQKFLQNFLQKVKTKLSLSTDEAQGFTIPLAIVLTSMLKDEGVSGQFADRKFNTFLLSEQEYWPYVTGAHVIDSNVTIEEAVQIIRSKSKETLDIIGVTMNDIDMVKTFVDRNKQDILDDREDSVPKNKPISLLDIYNFADFSDSDDASKVVEVIKNITTTNDGKIQKQSELIGNMYSEANYEQRLAEHLMNALTADQQ